MLDYRVQSFLAVCQTGSYTRAAARLHITQPAITQHVHALEAHYGCPLFEREGRSMRLTAAGEVVRCRLQTMTNDELRLRREVAAASAGDAARPLRLGCTLTIADYVAPRIVARVAEGLSVVTDATPNDVAPAAPGCPPAGLSLTVGNTAELTRALEEGRLDVALVEGSFDRKRFDAEVLSREPFVAVTGAAGGEITRSATLAGLTGRALVVRERGSGSREILERLLAAHDLALADFASVVELGGIPAIKSYVVTGDAVTFLYRIAAAEELASGSLVDVTPRDALLMHDLSGIWQQGSIYTPELRETVRTWRDWLASAAA